MPIPAELSIIFLYSLHTSSPLSVMAWNINNCSINRLLLCTFMLLSSGTLIVAKYDGPEAISNGDFRCW